MILDKTFITIKNNPIGFVSGVVAGYYVAKKYYPATGNPLFKFGIVFLSGLVGTGIEYSIRSKISVGKTASEIKK